MFVFQQGIISSVSVFDRFFRAIVDRSVLDLTIQQEKEEGEQHDINDGEEDQGKEDLDRKSVV